MEKLSSTQRKYLRGLAHPLKPLVIVGQQGITSSLIQAINEALEEHELIKIKFYKFKEEKKQYSIDIAEQSGAELVGLIGNIAILYRQASDPEKRKIKFN